MTLDLAIDAFTLAAPLESNPAAVSPREAAHQASQLRRWFGVEFTILSADSGDTLHLAGDQPCRDWLSRIELCQEVVRRGTPEFIDEDFPLLVLALPMTPSCVAVATFLTRAIDSKAEFARAAGFLRCSIEQAEQWVLRQTPVSADTLLRLASLVQQYEEAQQRIDSLEADVDKLSLHVSSTYEEISLLIRLTQNLKINANEAVLGRMALEWLGEIMPFEGLALQFLPRPASSRPNNESAVEPTLLTFGACPLDNESFSRMVQELGITGDGHPVVINHTAAYRGGWRHSDVRQLLVMPLGESRQLFGYLAAFNHRGDREFGTSEADLLGSVATILGIHSGNAELYRQQEDLLAGIVRALTSAIDAKDPYTCGHSDRVARVAVRIAQEMNCDAKTIDTIYLAGLLHDVGKIGIDDNVLRKSGRLTQSEFEHIQTHVRIGHNILVDLKQLDKVLPIVLHHHESWDGTGYPDGLSGEQIPPLARIVSVADAFDAMKSNRPYRQGMADDKLDAIIRGGAGTQWDARVVDAFFRAREDIRQIAQHESSETLLDVPHYL